jgi:hypothetical protein
MGDRAVALLLDAIGDVGEHPGPLPAGMLVVEHGGTLVPGAPADLVAYPADPCTCAAGELLELAPAATVIGGQLTYRAGL